MKQEKTGRYEDIIGLARPVSARHRPMPRETRAAQFAPFAALTGYEESVLETQRLTQRRREPGEDEAAQLDARLRCLQGAVHLQPEAVFTCFTPDKTKEGGEYRRIAGRVRRIDQAAGRVLLLGGGEIAIPSICAVESPVLDMEI